MSGPSNSNQDGWSSPSSDQHKSGRTSSTLYYESWSVNHGVDDNHGVDAIIIFDE